MRVAPRDDGLRRPLVPIQPTMRTGRRRGGGSKDAPDHAQGRSRGYGLIRISEDSSISAGHVLNRSMRADDFFRDSSFLSRVAGCDQSLHSCNRRNEHGA